MRKDDLDLLARSRAYALMSKVQKRGRLPQLISHLRLESDRHQDAKSNLRSVSDRQQDAKSSIIATCVFSVYYNP